MILPSSLQLNTQTILKCVSWLIASQYICKQYWTGLSRLTDGQCKISDHFNNLNGTGNISQRTAWHTSITLAIIMFIRNVLLHYIEILILTSVTLGEYYFLAMGAWGRKIFNKHDDGDNDNDGHKEDGNGEGYGEDRVWGARGGPLYPSGQTTQK